MEAFVFSLYGLWFWITRNYRTARYREAAGSLTAARTYLLDDFRSRASTRDRGYLLSHHLEALDLLERHSAFIARTSRRFVSLSECCRFIAEELTLPQAPIEVNPSVPQVSLPTAPLFAPIARRAAAVMAACLSSLSSLSSLWFSENSGAIGDLRRTRWGMCALFAGSANLLSRLVPNFKQQIQ